MVIMKTPPKKLKSKSQISDFYAKTLARVLGSKNEAEIYIYEQISQALARLSEVLSVKPDWNIGSTKDYSLSIDYKNYKGLPFHTSMTTLRAKFEIYGEVVKARIPWDPISNRSKGYGFIEYATEEAAGVALKKMNGKIIAGRVIGVVAAESDPPRIQEKPTKASWQGAPKCS